MESKMPEWLLSFYESLFLAQLRTVRQLKSPKPRKAKRVEGKSMSNMDMAIDILRRGQRPLHISEIIAQVKTKHGVTLDRKQARMGRQITADAGSQKTGRNCSKLIGRPQTVGIPLPSGF